ncbi:MAG: hypothetical protein IJN82_02215, partial [Clostridia bacterium]|nr:hypothetical protein [Clostridia bacterium]
GCKAAKEETVALAAGFVPEAETQGAEELKKEPEILPSEQPKEEEKEPSQEQEQPIEKDPPAPQAPRKLTVEDVISLSEKGEALSYKDFEPFIYTEEQYEERKDTYVRRQYVIDEQFTLMLSFYQNTERTMSVLLSANDTLENMMLDVRAGGAETFVAEHRNAAVLTPVEYEWEKQEEWQPYEDFLEYAEKHGAVSYSKSGKLDGGYVRFDTYEAYQAYAGIDADSEYDAKFFEEKSLFVFNNYYSGIWNASRYIVGKQSGTLYLSGISLSPVDANSACVMIYYLHHIAISRAQLADVAEIEMRGQSVRYIADPENRDDWVEPEPEYPPPPDYSAELPQE